MGSYREFIKKISTDYPRAKKLIGLLLIVLGLLALVTPLTPGSWLIFVGLELLGFHLAVWDRIKSWLSK